MNGDLKKIKKKYGEGMAKFCRSEFSTILETEGLLSKVLMDNFEPNRELYSDILENDLESSFKNYVYSLMDNGKIKKVNSLKSPKELMSEAGYNLYECKTEEEIQEFKKYYAPKEAICTFYQQRLNRCYVFFAVKKDVDNIKREDFLNPRREDLYGTSVISIQFSKDSRHTLSIKNRYNHAVNNPDATFSNNLDNIIPGLTKSFEREYGFVQKYCNDKFSIPGYTVADDGRYYKYNYKINDVYYCPGNIIIDNGKVKKFEKEKYILLDYFLLDLTNKTIKLYDKDISDSFVGNISNINKIVLENDKGVKHINIILNDHNSVEISLDKQNRIIGFVDNNIKEITDNFLFYSMFLRNIEISDVQKIGKNFLSFNYDLVNLDIPNVCEIGDRFLYLNDNLKNLSLPNLKICKDSFLVNNASLVNLNLPSLEFVGDDFLAYNDSIVDLSLPNLKEVGNNFLENSEKIGCLDLPKLEKCGDLFLYNNRLLSNVDFSNLREVGDDFLYNNEFIINLNLPKLEKCGRNFLLWNLYLEYLSIPNLEEVGNNFLLNCDYIKNLYAPKIKDKRIVSVIEIPEKVKTL